MTRSLDPEDLRLAVFGAFAADGRAPGSRLSPASSGRARPRSRPAFESSRADATSCWTTWTGS